MTQWNLYISDFIDPLPDRSSELNSESEDLMLLVRYVVQLDTTDQFVGFVCRIFLQTLL